MKCYADMNLHWHTSTHMLNFVVPQYLLQFGALESPTERISESRVRVSLGVHAHTHNYIRGVPVIDEES